MHKDSGVEPAECTAFAAFPARTLFQSLGSLSQRIEAAGDTRKSVVDASVAIKPGMAYANTSGNITAIDSLDRAKAMPGNATAGELDGGRRVVAEKPPGPTEQPTRMDQLHP